MRRRSTHPLVRALFVVFVSALGACQSAQQSAPPTTAAIDWWSMPRHGANASNHVMDVEFFRAAAEAHIAFIRMFPTDLPSTSRDFLIGDADEYRGLVANDVAQVRAALDAAQQANVKVVLTLTSLPGARWRQHNGGRADLRVWRDERYLTQVGAFWSDLAAALKDHPAIAGYDIINEPHPERVGGFDDLWSQDVTSWTESVRGTPADLNRFNQTVVSAIRAVDRNVPIVVECGMWADLRMMRHLEPIDDRAVLYSFHFYEPYRYTNRELNRGQFEYPGVITAHDGPDGTTRWDRAAISAYMVPVKRWCEEHGVPASRVLVGEFGVNRMNAGADRYLGDVIAAMNANGWHWAFYSYREEKWPGMDYELGDRQLSEAYWDELAQGRIPLFDAPKGEGAQPPSATISDAERIRRRNDFYKRVLERDPSASWAVLTEALRGGGASADSIDAP